MPQTKVIAALAIGAPTATIPLIELPAVEVSPPVLVQPENGLDELEDALHAVTVTELVATLLLPSVMVMVATYSPATSALKLGLAAVVLTSEALLPAGLVNAHE